MLQPVSNTVSHGHSILAGTTHRCHMLLGCAVIMIENNGEDISYVPSRLFFLVAALLCPSVSKYSYDA